MTPRPALLRPPVPQPGMIVVVASAIVGQPPLSSLVLAVTGDVVLIAGPDRLIPMPLATWPVPSILAVYTGTGRLLWDRSVATAPSVPLGEGEGEEA